MPALFQQVSEVLGAVDSRQVKEIVGGDGGLVAIAQHRIEPAVRDKEVEDIRVEERVVEDARCGEAAVRCLHGGAVLLFLLLRRVVAAGVVIWI